MIFINNITWVYFFFFFKFQILSWILIIDKAVLVIGTPNIYTKKTIILIKKKKQKWLSTAKPTQKLQIFSWECIVLKLFQFGPKKTNQNQFGPKNTAKHRLRLRGTFQLVLYKSNNREQTQSRSLFHKRKKNL